MNRSVSLVCALYESGRKHFLRFKATTYGIRHTVAAKLKHGYHFQQKQLNSKTCDEMNDAKLIDLVEAQPCIYDKTDLFYSNKEHVRSIWQMIGGEMQQEVPVCQKRWRYLRDYFVRQLHITENNANDGENKPPATSATKRSFWPLYDRLSFLKPFSSTRRRPKRVSTEDVNTAPLKTEDDLNSSPSDSSDGSGRTRASSCTNVSENYTCAIANLDYLKFYQAMQMAAQQNLDTSTSNNSDSRLPLEFDKLPAKRKRNQSDFFPAFQPVDYAIDEHDCFFKSLLSSVRGISDEHIIAFRTEVLQIIMKYRHLSEVIDENGDVSYGEVTNDDQNADNVVVVNTEEAHWRKNLLRKQF